jgi:hypothetical protein
MATQAARSPRDGSKISLQSLHARYNQVTQIVQCLCISMESEAESIEPVEVCRAIVDMLDDINSDLWTFLEPALFQRIEAKETARKAAILRKRAHVSIDVSHGANGLHADNSAANGNGTDGATTKDPAQERPGSSCSIPADPSLSAIKPQQERHERASREKQFYERIGREFP